MIDLYYWPTPNGRKVSILLEEIEVPYKIIPIDINNKKQFSKDFTAISPSNKIPAIINNMNSKFLNTDPTSRNSSFNFSSKLIPLLRNTFCKV